MSNQFYPYPSYSSQFLGTQFSYQNKASQSPPPVNQTNIPETDNSLYKKEVIEWQTTINYIPYTQRFQNFSCGQQQTFQVQDKTFRQRYNIIHVCRHCPPHYQDFQQTHSLFENSKSPSRFPSATQELERKCLSRPVKDADLQTEGFKAQQKLLSMIKIFDKEKLFDSIILTESIEEIISICEKASEGNAFQSQPRVTYNHHTKTYTSQDSIWFVPLSYQYCGGWIVNEIEKAIAIMITKNNRYPDPHESVLSKFEDLNTFWSTLGRNKKLMVSNHAQMIWKQLKSTYRQTAQTANYRKLFKDTEWLKSFDEETKWVLNLLTWEKKLEPTILQDPNMAEKIDQKFINRCMFISLEDTLSISTFVFKKMLNYIVPLHQEKIRQELIKQETKQKKPKKSKPKKKNKKPKSEQNLAEEQISNQTNDEKPFSINTDYNYISETLSTSSQSIRMTPSTPPNSPLSACTEIKNNFFDSQQEDEPTQDEQIKKPTPRKPKIKQPRENKQKPQRIVEKPPTPPKEVEQTEEINEDIMLEAQQKLETKLNKDLVQFTQNMLSECDKLLQFRKLIFNRIQFVVKNIFKDYEIDVRLYGSCATGMALPDSDIDLAIFGLEMIPYGQLYFPLQLLVSIFSEVSWVVSINPIVNSSVPVVKLEVDPFIPMDECTKKMPVHFYKILKDLDTTFLDPQSPCPTEKLIFKVDITINNCDRFNHGNMGLHSTELVLGWSNMYKELQYLVLFLKSILKKRGLNQQYKGGLSSFCTILMVLSFVEHYYQKNEVRNLGAIFYSMLKFYGTEFDFQKQGIYFQGRGVNPFFQMDFDHLVPIQIMSPISNEIISSSCAFFNVIVQDLKLMFQAAEEEKINLYQRIVKKKRLRKPTPNFVLLELERITPMFGIEM